MKNLIALSLAVSSFAFGALSPEDLKALKPLALYYSRTETTGDNWAIRMCPEVMGLSVSAQDGVRVVEHFQGSDQEIGIMDPESPRSYYAWHFPADEINGKGKKITDWNQISNGLFNRPSPDPLFRKAIVRFKHTLTTEPNVRLVQQVTYTPYTLAILRWGKQDVVTSELIETSEGLLLRRKINGVEKRSCRYVPATKEQVEKAGHDNEK